MKTKSRRIDQDVSALKACVRGLNKCSSRRMVLATLDFLWDRYLQNPSRELPQHLK